jgi:hypothetical protein
MPLVTYPRIGKRLRRVAVLTALTCFAGPAAAQAACPTASTVKAFQAFGDSSDYFLATNGSFESGASGWSLTGASVVSGNESSKVHGSADSKSLAINATGMAVSPSFCVGIQHPAFRLFARRTSGTWGNLNVKLRWKDSSGATNETVVSSVGSSDTVWHPTGRIALSTVLPLWKADQTASVQVVFDPEDYGGAWAIDDVYIDPYRTG